MDGKEDLTDSEMNPYERYRHVAFTLSEFLKMVKENRKHFINYCEIVITENGFIFLASPSHDSVVEWLKKKGFVDCISVWYNDWGFGSCVSKDYKKLTVIQWRILKSLDDHGLILMRYDSILSAQMKEEKNNGRKDADL